VLAPFPPHLGWTHYLVLLRVTNPTARAFYEIEAVRESWSSREPENNEQILAARYQMYLPTEEELRAELAREREAVERALRLAASVNGDDKCSESSR
jgi:predicted nuclease of restriction endonuclease-like (RecB) superfamily